MNLLNMREVILPQFSGIPPVQLQFDLNRAVESFARRTRILGTRVAINIASDFVTSDETMSIDRYNLPGDFDEVISIDELPRSQYCIKNDLLEVFHINGSLTELWMHYIPIPSPMVNDTDTPGFLAEFHPAVVAKVLTQYYGTRGVIEAAKFQSEMYREQIREAIAYSNSRIYRTVASIGDTVTIAKAEGYTIVAGMNIIPLGKTFTSGDSYAVVTNAGDVDVSTTDPSTGLPVKTATTFQVWASAGTDSFEFIAVGS